MLFQMVYGIVIVSKNGEIYLILPTLQAKGVFTMGRKRFCVIGHFGFGKNMLNGQTVKTKILAATLEQTLGEEQVMKIDTHGGIKALLKTPIQTFRALLHCNNVVILPAHRGLRVVTPFLCFWNLFFKRNLHYAVIGGWLPTFLENKKHLARQLKTFSGIYVETRTMQAAMEAKGFDNVTVMPNCKSLPILSPEELPAHQKPYKLCTFSRVMREKGIEDAVNAVIAANTALGETTYVLDIYGQVDANQTEWFDALQKTFPDYIRYGGLVPFDKSVEVLKDYFALLFPTRFFTEGIPGTVVDAYAAGVPVISARWKSFDDVIDDTITGYGYPFGDNEALTTLLTEAARDPGRINKLKTNCLNKAHNYTPDKAMAVLLEKERVHK